MSVIFKCQEKQVVDLIQAHRYLYHVLRLPVATDAYYDHLVTIARRAGVDVDGPTRYVAPGARDSLTDFDGAKEMPTYTEEQILIAQRLLAAA